MLIKKKIYEGDVKRDIFGSWDDCSPGLYIDHDDVESIVEEFRGERVRITIEVIEKEES